MPILGLGNRLNKGSGDFKWKNKYSLNFDGTDTYVTLADGNLAFTESADFSVSCWVKTPDDSTQDVLVDHYDGSSVGWKVVVKSNGKVAVSVRDADGDAINSQDNGDVIDDDGWHHVLFTVDRSSGCTHIRYIDAGAGTSRANTSVDGLLSAGTPFNFGASQAAPGGNTANYLAGYLDEVVIWDKVLVANEVTALYNSGSPIDPRKNSGNYVSSGNVQLYYRMGDGASYPFIPDSSGNGLHGTMTDMAANDIEAEVA